MIQIDGSHGEGGGSLLRQALAFSILTQKPFRIINIRANRPKPGLNHQHVNSIILAQKVCGAKAIGAKIGSSSVEFYPGKIEKNVDINIDIKTAGSLTLMLQSIFLPCVFSGKKIKFTLTGGTDVSWSPPFDYFNFVFIPLFRKYASIECSLMQRGYYPKGRGKVRLVIDSKSSIKDVERLNLLSLGEIIAIKGVSHASLDLETAGTAESQAKNASFLLSDHNVPVDIKPMYYDSESTGSGITIYGLFKNNENPDDTFRAGVSKIVPGPEFSKIAEEAAHEFNILVNKKIPVDEHLADQLIPLLAFSKGTIKTTSITNHTLSNIYVTELFLDVKIKVMEKEKIISLT